MSYTNNLKKKIMDELLKPFIETATRMVGKGCNYEKYILIEPNFLQFITELSLLKQENEKLKKLVEAAFKFAYARRNIAIRYSEDWGQFKENNLLTV